METVKEIRDELTVLNDMYEKIKNMEDDVAEKLSSISKKSKDYFVDLIHFDLYLNDGCIDGIINGIDSIDGIA